ncbi:hypothetical protein P5673_023204 [Acropora cervicornis]|uniref:Uncharacterized protein n=1 Tax=Acropora cervicornis TaxID=6130 RepID=A0AAD9Q5S5_ACRCE|nr:hypothetical protein P5673_023204 [Acropora cervicornis]
MTVEFRIADQPFASGGFREAFKATSDTPGFSGVTWIIKKYLKGILEDITVQMHPLARNFTSEVEKETLTEFDTTFHYKKQDERLKNSFMACLLSILTINMGTCALKMMSSATRLSILHISHIKSHRESLWY